MQLPLSAAVAARLEILDECGSTNTELVGRASGADAENWPDFSVIVTGSQTAGRGRLGRVPSIRARRGVMLKRSSVGSFAFGLK